MLCSGMMFTAVVKLKDGRFEGNAFCLTSHWCYQTPRCSAATYSAGRPGDVSWFRCLTDCLSFPLFIIPSFRLNNSRPYFFRWVSPPSLSYSGRTDLRRSSSSRTQESVRVWWCLMQRCCFGLALTQTPFFSTHIFGDGVSRRADARGDKS